LKEERGGRVFVFFLSGFMSGSTVSAQKIRIILKSFDHTIIDEAALTILETAKRSGAITAGPVPLPVRIQKFTLNRATFASKDARDQYEIRTYKRLIDITEATGKTVDLLQSLHLPAGVDVSIKMVMEG
jgi:small subunit ribosomal protein S10